jgi:hypothetical protein
MDKAVVNGRGPCLHREGGAAAQVHHIICPWANCVSLLYFFVLDQATDCVRWALIQQGRTVLSRAWHHACIP